MVEYSYCVSVCAIPFPDQPFRYASAYHFLRAAIGLNTKSGQLFMLLAGTYTHSHDVSEISVGSTHHTPIPSGPGSPQ